VLFMLLFIFWVVLSSKITLIQLIVGFFASLLVVFYNYDLVFNDLEATKITFKFIGRLIHLFIVLLIEIVKSNIHVMMIVLSPKMKINPGFKKIKQPLKKEFNQALFANAITLTPGTLTVDMDDEYILVHGLEMEHIDDIKKSDMQKAFERLEA
ncbi:MAG: Na+/H+ antiporter subunit E, partial [Acholeplasmataceae bacterium]